MLFCIFSTYLSNGLGWRQMDLFYAAFMRFFFLLGLSWITFLMTRGDEGIIELVNWQILTIKSAWIEPKRMFSIFEKLTSKRLSKISFAASLTNVEIERFVFLTRNTLGDRNLIFMVIQLMTTYDSHWRWYQLSIVGSNNWFHNYHDFGRILDSHNHRNAF